MQTDAEVAAIAAVVSGCRIGSFKRHQTCMYAPCRSVAQHLKQENAK